MGNVLDEDEELKKILSTDLDALDGIDAPDPFAELGQSGREKASGPTGSDLVGRIRASHGFRAHEAQWSRGEAQDGPQGRPFAQSLMQLLASERTGPYKSNVLQQYRSTAGQVRDIYRQILVGDMLTAGPVRTVVITVMDIFSKDRNLLLNLALGRVEVQAEYCYQHSLDACILAVATASSGGFSRAQVLEIAQGALLADVGMQLIPESILNKSGRLSEEELREIHKHPLLGYGLLESVQGLPEAVYAAVYQHHERLSGMGYPARLQGKQVTHAARIAAVADTLAALVNKRNHREALSPAAALESVVKMGKMNFLDAGHVRSLMGMLSVYPIGSLVKLASGKVAKVVEPHADDPLKPTVSILHNEKGQALPVQNPLQVDLRRSQQERIVQALDSGAVKHDVLDGF